MDDNKSMVSTIAAHMQDAARMMRNQRAPSPTTIRGLMEAVRWLDSQRRIALERLNKVEGTLFSLAGQMPEPPLPLIDTLIEYESWWGMDAQDAEFDTLEKKARAFIKAYEKSFPGRQLPGVAPKPHTPEEEL